MFQVDDAERMMRVLNLFPQGQTAESTVSNDVLFKLVCLLSANQLPCSHIQVKLTTLVLST
jgi:hypothetical protein